MRIGVSLPYAWLRDGGELFGDREAFFASLSALNIASVELRSVSPGENPASVAKVAEELWNRGFRITVHGAIRKAESAADDLLYPLSLLFGQMRQKNLVVVAHSPVTDDLGGMLRRLSDEIKRRQLPVTVALENNRRMPDGSEGDSASLVERAVLEADAPNVGICFDMGHFYYHAVKNAGDPALLPSKAFLNRAVHTHIHATCELNTHFPLIEAFVLPLREYIDALGIGYEGLYNLELDFPRFADRMEPAPAVFASLKTLSDTVSYRRMLHEDIRKHFVGRMERAVSVWDSPADAVSQMNSSSYCLRLGRTNLAVDPALREALRLTDAAERLPALFAKADGVLISHGHEDHFEEETVRLLKGSGLTWIIPDFLRDQAHSFGLTDEQILWAQDDVPLTFGELTIHPFASRHFRTYNNDGVPEYGYFLTCPGAPSLLFPGDLRDYRLEGQPGLSASGADYLFAHVWMGDYCGLKTHFEPYDTAEADYLLAYRPKNIIFGHLYESGRLDDGMWRREHALLLAQRIRERSPDTRTHLLPAGEILLL